MINISVKQITATSIKRCSSLRQKRLQQFIAAADIEEAIKMRKAGPLELLQFLQKYNLGNSVPNTVIMLRIFLTITVSLATCEKRFSRLKLIKKFLKIWYEHFAVEKS